MISWANFLIGMPGFVLYKSDVKLLISNHIDLFQVFVLSSVYIHILQLQHLE
jgi:hypothetical protein